MCPFWRRTSQNLSLYAEKEILRKIYNAGICGVAFEGGEPLLRKDLDELLAFSYSLPLHTSLITNGTLLKSRIDEIAPYINGVVYVSLDGLEKTHDQIRGVSGCFKKAVEGIIAAEKQVPVTINTTIMAENAHEIIDLVKLAKDLGVKISLSLSHQYHDIDGIAPKLSETSRIAQELIEMKKQGYPLVNTASYFRVMAKQKNWKCKPWTLINVGTDGKLVLPCYVRNQYATSASVFETSIKDAIAGYPWKQTKNCVKCNLHCYVEPSLVLSGDVHSYADWAFRVRA
jgi:MoaA/NifB/PqqE/SkfB family radical SAM enzyme